MAFVEFKHRDSGIIFRVHESRVEQYKAAGHVPVAESAEKKTTTKKTTTKKTTTKKKTKE